MPTRDLAGNGNRCYEADPRTDTVLFGDHFINLSHIARKSGLSLSTVSKIFSGHRNPSMKSAEKIATALDITLGVFLSRLKKRTDILR